MAWSLATSGLFRRLPAARLLASHVRSAAPASVVSSVSVLSNNTWNSATAFSTVTTTGSSSNTTAATTSNSSSSNSTIPPHVLQDSSGRQFAVFDMTRRKLKPSIIARRLNRMRIYEGKEKSIRHSPWRLNLVCQLVAGLPLQQALTQLEFSVKSKAPLVQKVLQRTANLADIQDGLQVSQLEVAECFSTRATPLKRMKTMGRGRTGRMEHKHSHMRVVLREIDFKLRIYQAPTVNQKKKWLLMQQTADRDHARALAERQEVERLEQQMKATAKKV